MKPKIQDLTDREIQEGIYRHTKQIAGDTDFIQLILKVCIAVSIIVVGILLIIS